MIKYTRVIPSQGFRRLCHVYFLIILFVFKKISLKLDNKAYHEWSVKITVNFGPSYL